MDVNEKHAKIKLWLEDIFTDESIPQFEINSTTMTILEQLSKRNRQHDHYTRLIIDDMEQKTSEYAVEAKRTNRILTDIGLPLSSLSQSGTLSIKTLTNIALLLGLKDCASSSLMLGVSSQSNALDAARDDRDSEKTLYSRLLAKTKAALIRENTLQRALQTLEEQDMLQAPLLDKRAQETGFLRSKSKEYNRSVKELEGILKEVGLDQSVYHESLVKKAEDVNYLREKSKPLKAKLDNYQSLPPDLALARVKVEEAKRELAKLEQELSSNINMLHI